MVVDSCKARWIKSAVELKNPRLSNVRENHVRECRPVVRNDHLSVIKKVRLLEDVVVFQPHLRKAFFLQHAEELRAHEP